MTAEPRPFTRLNSQEAEIFASFETSTLELFNHVGTVKERIEYLSGVQKDVDRMLRNAELAGDFTISAKLRISRACEVLEHFAADLSSLAQDTFSCSDDWDKIKHKYSEHDERKYRRGYRTVTRIIKSKWDGYTRIPSSNHLFYMGKVISFLLEMGYKYSEFSEHISEFTSSIKELDHNTDNIYLFGDLETLDVFLRSLLSRCLEDGDMAKAINNLVGLQGSLSEIAGD